jgi:hypothetical protein
MLAKDIFQSRYQTIVDDHAKYGYEMIQQHFGPMGSEDDVNAIAYDLETVLADRGEKKGVVKRAFSLIIEALQNIRLHGERDSNGEQLAYYTFAENKESREFMISTADIILNKNIYRVQPKIDKINSLDRAGLKELYMETLTDGERSVKGGAGLGFITVAMKSKNKIDYDLVDVGNDSSFFEMKTNLVTKKEIKDE